MHKVTRAMCHLHMKSVSVNRTLVVSGGCACSQYLRSDLQKLCNLRNYRLFVPSPAVCIDNAVMIGYSAVEMMKEGYPPIGMESFDSVVVDGFAKIGLNVTDKVERHGKITSCYERLTGGAKEPQAKFLNNSDSEYCTTDLSVLWTS